MDDLRSLLDTAFEEVIGRIVRVELRLASLRQASDSRAHDELVRLTDMVQQQDGAVRELQDGLTRVERLLRDR